MAPSRRRRAAPEDDVEDADQTQRPEHDDVDMGEEEDAQPRRAKGKGKAPATSSKGARAGTSRRQQDAGDNDGDEERNDDVRFNEEAFGNKPINAHEGQKLQGMASDWNQMGQTLKNSAFTLLNEVASAVAEVNDGQDSEVCPRRSAFAATGAEYALLQELRKLDVLMKELIGIHVELEQHAQVLTELHSAVRSGEEIARCITITLTIGY
jgi:hypothetical protein